MNNLLEGLIMKWKLHNKRKKYRKKPTKHKKRKMGNNKHPFTHQIF